MENEREKWNERYQARAGPGTPDAIVREFAPQAPRGLALDVACGLGANASLMADLGFSVQAMDISDEAVRRVHERDRRIQAFQADAGTFPFPGNTYSLILVIRYLERSLFPVLQEALVPGGVLIFETYLDWKTREKGPKNKSFLLRKNELLHSLDGMQVIFYREVPEREEGPAQASYVGLKETTEPDSLTS